MSMRGRSSPGRSILILSVLGLLAALTVVPHATVADGAALPLFLGSSMGISPRDVFGALIAICFWNYAGIRSVAKAIGLVVVLQAKRVASLASTSSRMGCGTLSSLRPLRAARSS